MEIGPNGKIVLQKVMQGFRLRVQPYQGNGKDQDYTNLNSIELKCEDLDGIEPYILYVVNNM